MKKAFWIFNIVFLTIVGLVAVALSLGTFVSIPYVSSVAAFPTLQYAHVYIPICLGLALVSLLTYLSRNKFFPTVLVILFIAAFGMSSAAYALAVKSCNDQGAEVKVFDVYKKKNFDSLKKDTVVYTTSDKGELHLDVYTSADGRTGKPVVVYIHGGGWTTGSRNNLAYRTKTFAQDGYVSVSVDYDLSSADNHYAIASETHVSTEVQLTYALAWVKEHAADYGGDIDKLYLIGDSAGGNLVLDLAYKINGGTYVTAGEVVLPHIQAVCAVYPVADPAQFYNNDDKIYGSYIRDMCLAYVGAAPADNSAAYHDITPANFLTPSAPRTLLIVGAGDKIVDPQESKDLLKALEANGTQAKLIEIPYVNHAFDYVDGTFGCDAVTDMAEGFFVG